MECMEKEGHFLSYGDTKIFYKSSKIESPKAVVIFVHGICEHLERYEYIKNKFVLEGYSVYRYDARGHGKSEGRRGYLRSFEDYLNDLDVFVDIVRNENLKSKIILIGHSMGGLVVTAYTSKYPEKIDLLGISGGCNVCPKIARAIKYLPYNMMGKMKYVNKLGEGVCSDKKVTAEYEKDPLVLKKVSMRLVGNVFSYGTKYVKNNIKKIKCPTIVMHGENDQIVVKETGVWTYEHLMCKDTTLKIYSGLMHEIFNEVDKEKVIKDLLEWCNERVVK